MSPHPRHASTNILNWNANGIRSKTSELLALMEATKSRVALICETHLQPGHQLRLANHAVYRTDRPGGNAHGGTAVIVHNSLVHEEIELPKLHRLEATGVLLHTAKGLLRVIAVYSPPGWPIVELDVEALLDSRQPTLVAGDLNAKHPDWNCQTTNPAGRKLRAQGMREDFTISGPIEPTRVPIQARHRPSVLDITISKNMAHSLDMETLPALSSDHNPVLITVGADLDLAPPIRKPNWKRADWPLFQKTLEPTIASTPITTADDLDEAVVDITAAIQAAIATSVPLSSPRRNDRFDLPPHILQLIQEKNRAKRRWQRSRTPDLRDAWQSLQRSLDALLHDFHVQRWDQAVGELEFDDNSIWQMTRRLLRKPIPSPPMQGKTHLACSAKDKAEVLADSLQEQFTPNPASRITAQVTAQVGIFLDGHRQSAHEGDASTVTLSEMDTHVRLLKDKKAPGQDGITNRVIKELPNVACTRLVDIFNASLRLQHFPRPWKEAKIIAFPKPGKQLRDPANWRPISLLSGLSKLLERAILSRLTAHSDREKTVIDEQFGFRGEHSTNHQLLRVVNRITDGFNRKRHTAAIFLDVAKAFDRVWHIGLVHKLAQADFPPYLVNLMASYLGGRHFHVTMRGERSTTRPIAAGVPQGSIIAPFLFNIYMNDVPVTTQGSELALYADDAALLFQSQSLRLVEKHLQPALDTLAEWYSDWRIGINTAKTTATLFTRRARHAQPPDIFLLGEQLTWTKTSKYLGLVLDHQVTWKPHIADTTSKVLGKLALLRPLFRNDHMSLEAKVRLYKTIIRPTITYGSPVWGSCRQTLLARLQVAQNRCLKAAARLPVYARTAALHRDLEVEMMEDFVLALNTKFFSQLSTNPNPLIRAQLQHTSSPHDKFPRPMNSILPEPSLLVPQAPVPGDVVHLQVAKNIPQPANSHHTATNGLAGQAARENT